MLTFTVTAAITLIIPSCSLRVGSRLARNLLRSITELAMGNLMRGLLTAAFTIYLINRLSVFDFGVYSTIVAFSTITAVMVNFGLNTYLSREAGKDITLYRPIMRTVTAIRLFLFVLSEFTVVGILRILGFSWHITLLAVIFALDPLFTMLLESMYTLFYVKGEGKLVATAEVLKKVLLLVMVVVAVVYGIETVIAGYIISDIVIMLLVYANYSKAVRNLPEGKLSVPAFRILRESLPFSFRILTALIFWNTDTMMVSKMLGVAPVGIYNVSASFFKALSFAPQAFSSILFPKISLAHSRENLKAIRPMITESAKILIAFAILVVFYSKTSLGYYIIELFGKRYESSVRLLAPMSLMVIFYFPASLGQSVLMAIGREVKAVYALIAALISNFALNLVLIPALGLIGAVYATVSSQAVLLAFTVFYLRDQVGEVVDLELAKGVAYALASFGVVALVVDKLNPIVGGYTADNLYALPLILFHFTGYIKRDRFSIKEWMRANM